MISQRALILILLSCVLAACGGGGGGGSSGTGNDPPPTTPPPGGGPPNNPPPPFDPIAAENSNAQNARLTLYQSESSVAIFWVDLFDNELGFRVERRVGEGDWEPVADLPRTGGGPGFWARAMSTSAHLRVTAILPERLLPLQSTGGETEFYIDMDPATPRPTIQIDQAEPVRGAVQVSLQNAEPALSVSYHFGNVPFAHVTGGGTFPATLPAQQLVNGSQSLMASVQKSAGLWLRTSRPLQVDNPAPAVLLHFVTVAGTNQPMLAAQATADAGITAVEFFINGNSVQVVSSPQPQGDLFVGQYVYLLDPMTLPPGPLVVRAVATDSTTATAVMERTITVNRDPTLNVSGIFDGMIASGGSVNVTGNFGDDAPGATLTITAGELRVLRTQTSPFAVTFSLAGVPAGEHMVSFRVTDMYGKVSSHDYRVIVPSTQLQYQLLDRDVERLLSADQGSVLYRRSSGAVMLRNPAGLATQFPAASASFAAYRLTDGGIVAYSQDRHLYAIDASGNATDLAPAGYREYSGVTVRGPWVSWLPADAPSIIRLYNLRTRVSRDVSITGTLASQAPEIVTTPGNERLLFSGTIDGVTGSYSHNLVTHATQLMMSGSISTPRTDGTRMLWFDLTDIPYDLVVAPLVNPTATLVLSSNVAQATIADGLVCWRDRDHTLFVNDGSVTTQLSPLTTTIDSCSDGRVVFSEDGQMRVWRSATGEQVWLDTLASTLQADGVAYFLTGSSGALYRVTLP